MDSHVHIRAPILVAIFALASLCQLQPASAQQRQLEVADGFPLDIQFTNTISNSNSPLLQFSIQDVPAVSPRRSPLIAGLLSAAVPGLGQSYADDWSISIRSVAFFAVEAGLWYAAISNNNKGDSQTEVFQRYADEHWDVTRYAGWIEANIGGLNNEVNTSGMITSTDPLLAPWERVNWTRINEVEDGIGQKTGTGFTHRLPHRPEQQYYELIGKYAQFGGGWDDAPGFTPQDLLASNVSPRFLEYSLMRGRANDLYSNATTASYLIVANHIISALEAAWSTSRANKGLEARAEFRHVDRGGWSERVPHVLVRVEL